MKKFQHLPCAATFLASYINGTRPSSLCVNILVGSESSYGISAFANSHTVSPSEYMSLGT